MPTEPASHSRGRYRWLLAAMVLAGAFEAAIAARSPVIAKDGIVFIRIAQRLPHDAASIFRQEDQHPGYPALIWASSLPARLLPHHDEFGMWIVAAHLAAGLAGVASILFLWLLARRVFYDPRVANVAAVLAAAWPLLRQNAADALSDTPHLMLYLAAAWLACEAVARGGLLWSAGAGMASGLAYWVRPEGLIVALAAGAVMAARMSCPRCAVRAKRAAELTSLALVMLAVIAPYVLVSGKLTSKKGPFANKAVVQVANRPIVAPQASAVAAAASLGPVPGVLQEPAAGDVLADEHPRPDSESGVLGFALVELGKELGQGFRYLLLLPLAFGAFPPGAPRWQALPTAVMSVLLIVHLALLLALFHMAGYISHRHVMPLVAVLIPTTAAGLIYLSDKVWGFAWRRQASGYALAAMLSVIVALLAPRCLRPLHEVYYPVIEAAHWVKAFARPGDCVLTTSSYVRFYGRMDGIVVGPEAPDLPTGLAFAPDDRGWPFVVLEVDQREFDPSLLCHSNLGYELAVEIVGHPTKPWSKVIVYRAKQAARVVAGQPTAAAAPR